MEAKAAKCFPQYGVHWIADTTLGVEWHAQHLAEEA